MEHTQNTTPQDSQATTKAAAPTTKAVRVPWGIIDLPADAETCWRENARLDELDAPTEAETKANNAEMHRLRNKYGKLMLTDYAEAADVLIAEEDAARRALDPKITKEELDAFFTRILNSAGMEALSLFGNHAFDRPAVCLTPFDFSTLMIFRSGKEAFEALLSPEHAAMLTATHKTALTTPGIGSEGIAKALQAFLARLDGPPKPPTPTAADEAEANARLAEELGEVEDREDPDTGDAAGLAFERRQKEHEASEFPTLLKHAVAFDNKGKGRQVDTGEVEAFFTACAEVFGGRFHDPRKSFRDYTPATPALTLEMYQLERLREACVAYIDETLKVDARDYAESLAAAAFDPTLARITILDKDVHEIRPDDLVLYMSAIFLRENRIAALETLIEHRHTSDDTREVCERLLVSFEEEDINDGTPRLETTEERLADILSRTACAILNLPPKPPKPPTPAGQPAAAPSPSTVSEEAPSYAAGKPTPELYACLTGNQVDTAAAMLDNGERVLVMLRNGTVSTIGTGYRADMPEHGELAIYPTDWTRQDGDTLVAEGSSWVELELSWVAWNEKEVALAAQPTKAVNYTSTDAFGVDRLVTTQLPADAEANWREFFQINDKRMDSPEMKANEGEYRRLSQKYGRDRMDNEFAFAVHALEAQEAEAEAAARRATENPDPAAAPNADPNANNLPTTPAPLEIPADAEAYCREFNRVASTDDPEGEMDSIRTMYEPLAAKYGHEKMNEFHRRLEARDYPAAPSVSEDAPSYAAQSAPENQEPATPAHAPALVAFFRKVLDEGPITILDDYLEVGDPDAFRFAEVYERDRVTGKPESAFAPETAEALQDEHDALLEDFSAKLLLDAALAVNEGKAGRPDGDTYTTPPVSLDNGATVDVILYEEGKRRVVHVVHSVFGLFAQLRIALGGTLDGYHPEEEVPTQYAAEHARLLAMVGINAMVEGAIAFEVWASRHEVGKEKGVLAQIHDNRPDPTPEVEPNPDDDPDEPWRDELGNAVPDFEEDDRDVYTALRVLEARSYELSQRDCDDDEKTEAGNVDEAIAALSSLRTRMQAWDKSRRDPVPSNFEHLLGRITTALAAIGFGDPDATYDADDVLTIIDQHWYDMLELTGIDQPASETAADVSAYAKPDEAFVGSHSSDSLDEARATALADAQQRALLDTLELLLTIDKRFDLECADIASSADPSRTFPCMATHDDIKAMIDRITKTLTTPAAAAATAAKGGN